MMERLTSVYRRAKNSDLMKTAFETTLMIGAFVAVDPVLRKLKIPITHTPAKATLEDSVDSIIGAPIIEEIMYRFIPSAIIHKHSPLEKAVSLWSSIKFAYSHNYSEDGIFTFKTIPLYHFADGLLFWRIMRKRGLPYSMAAHATHNLIVVGNAFIIKATENRKAKKVNSA